ncbi:sugar epimerase [Flavobacterium cellulosilyticum]|uniref:Sugar epimerase n=2 Tax=Flavobacterium cellulosilyticum TaxID=2541731 RepID=A0A4R5CFD0_9FLAO|nr:sugar epimerase [Flavobacterium cellulosilyticum]
MTPTIIKGNFHSDSRGILFYNNEFDTTSIKKIYLLENRDTNLIRAWQGHKIEQRWFSVIKGTFKIRLIFIDNWEQPLHNLNKIEFVLLSDKLDVLHVPAGYVSSIQAIEKNSKLLVMADYSFGEINDEYRFVDDYFD